MSLKAHFELMADYNRWMNSNIYQVSAELPAEVLNENRGAFFGSISGTLNHIMVGDIIWLRRFSHHPLGFNSLEPLELLPTIVSLEQILHHQFVNLRNTREKLDQVIIDFSREASEEHFQAPLPYKNTQGAPFTRRFGFLVQHFFNHQTHHRGQVTTLLTQLGLEPGVTDLLALIPDYED